MDRLFLEEPACVQPDEDSETNRILQRKGIEHEQEFLKTLLVAGKDVCDLSGCDERREKTLEAMQSGREIVYQAALCDGDFAGYADFLVKVQSENCSGLGDYQYEPWDTKLGLHARPYYLLQLACYADLLRSMQGALPQYMCIVLGNGELLRLRTADYYYQYLQVRDRFLDQQAKFCREAPPEVTGLEDFGRWSGEAQRRLTERDHVSQIANIRGTQVKRLCGAGFQTMTAFAESNNSEVVGVKSETLFRLRRQAQLQLASAGKTVPEYTIIEFELGKGLSALPPSSSMDVFFDMEGFPFVENGLEYLFGASSILNGELIFSDWWAHDSESERTAFDSFVEWVYERWKIDPEMHVYHYAAYERTALRRLMGKHGSCENELDELFRNEIFVDLFPIVRQSVLIGRSDYSLKSVEHLFREKRTGEVATAIDSVVFYQKWLDERDGDDWKSSAILSQIRAYNNEDCDSTYGLAKWLWNLQAAQSVNFQGLGAKPASQSAGAEARSEAARLARLMLDDVSSGSSLSADAARVQSLLAHLLQFHWREARPVFWSRYDRHAMSDDELFVDAGAISGLIRSAGEARPDKRSLLYDYSFDPEQETKIISGDSCFYAHDLSESISVETVDTQSGRITLRRSKDKSAPPPALILILDEFVDPSTIADAIQRTVNDFVTGIPLTSALEDFLYRRPPKIRDLQGGPLVDGKDDATAAVIDVVARMQSTTLCIQGPPGSGKTFTAAATIAHLLKLGQRVGITSSSHKAIAKLIDEVDKLLEDQPSIRGVKVQAKDSEFEVKRPRIFKLDPRSFFDKSRALFSFIGGTAWLFSDYRAKDLVDYLFVDEAGQVPVANLVAMSRATQNFVLIGDHQQLAQPLKGSHPGESGCSVLEYLLADQEVIDEDFGVFLKVTRRLHPNLCTFISGAIYQDRLECDPSTSNRYVIGKDSCRYVKKGTGVLYVAVEHDGNDQQSEEEVCEIKNIVAELLTLDKVVDGVKSSVELKDILIVAPYNMQVRRLRESISGCEVGTVDKFQGQEAPIVIVSMCASSGELSARSLDFVFSKNRLNVAISRAQMLAIVVGSPSLAQARCSTLKQMELANLYCRILRTSER